MYKQKGFTIIELVVVIAIIAILSAVVLISVGVYIKKAKDRIKQNNDERIKQKLEEKAHIAENRNKLLWKKTIRK